MENNIQTSDQYEEIDLRELFSVLWAGKVKIIAITAVFAVASVLHALSVPNQYEATVILAPAKQESGGLSDALGQLGGLASLAGVRVGGGSGEGQVALEIMKSWSFIEGFIEENGLAVGLSAVEGWDIESNELTINHNVYDVESNSWLVQKPTSWALFNSFSSRVSIRPHGNSGLLSISIEHYSPHVAKEWLDLYVVAINKHMQARQVAKVTNNIEYLEAQIEKTSITQMQEVFYTIIEDQIKSQMLAKASPEYAFTAVSPSMVPVEKSQPKRATISIFGTLSGGILSILLVLVMHYARKSD